MQFGYTSFEHQNLPLHKTKRICDRYDLLKLYNFGDWYMNHHTLILLAYLLLGPVCDIRFAIRTIRDYNQYYNLLKLLKVCTFIYELLKRSAYDPPRASSAYLDYLDEMRLLTSNLAKQCKHEYLILSAGRSPISTEQAKETVENRPISKTSTNISQELESTATPLLRRNSSEDDGASLIKDFAESKISDFTNFNKKDDKSSIADEAKIDEKATNSSNQLQLNDGDEETEHNKDFDYNPDYHNFVYGYIFSIGCYCGKQNCQCFNVTQD